MATCLLRIVGMKTMREVESVAKKPLDAALSVHFPGVAKVAHEAAAQRLSVSTACRVLAAFAIGGLSFPSSSFAQVNSGSSGAPKSNMASSTVKWNVARKDPGAIVEINKVNVTFDFDFAAEMRKSGITSGVALMPMPVDLEFQEVEIKSATVDGNPIEIIKDERGRPVFKIDVTPETKKAQIKAIFTIYQVDKSGDYQSPQTPKISSELKELGFRSDTKWLDYNSSEFVNFLIQKDLIREKSETAYEFMKRLQGWLNKETKYYIGGKDYLTMEEMASRFNGGDCRQFSIFCTNVARKNGVPVVFETNFPLYPSGGGWISCNNLLF